MSLILIHILSLSSALGAPLCSAVLSENKKTANYPPPALRMVYQVIGSAKTAVPFHILNVDSALASLRSEKLVKVKSVSFRSGNRKLEQLCVLSHQTCFMVVETRFKPSGTLEGYVLKDVMGRWFEVPAHRSALLQSRVVDFSQLKWIPSRDPDLNIFQDSVRATFDRGGWSRLSKKDLAVRLTKAQLETSTNAQRATGEPQRAFQEGVRKANEMLASLLSHRQELRVEHLEFLNLSVNSGVHPYYWKANAPMAGVLRGTQDRTRLIEGVETRIDFSDFEVAQQWQVFFPSSKVHRLNYFLPAAEVPTKVESLLKRINQLSRRSAPTEVFDLYKEFIHTHPFADGNGRTGRMLLNYMLLRSEMPPLERPSHSMFYRTHDILQKYLNQIGVRKQNFNFQEMKSFEGIKDIENLAIEIQAAYRLSKVKLEHLYGTSGYLFVGTYKNRFIQFESTHGGKELSDSVHVMISRAQEIIDAQESAAQSAGKPPPTYAIYLELLEQRPNFLRQTLLHSLVQRYLLRHRKPPSEEHLRKMQSSADQWVKSQQDLQDTRGLSDRDFLSELMKTPQPYKQVTSAEGVLRLLEPLISPPYRQRIAENLSTKATPEFQKDLVDLFNAFNSPKFDQFMVEVAFRALQKCRARGECGPDQRTQIPDKYLAEVLKEDADALGVKVETISRFVGREPGRLYFQRIRRGSLLIDDGAPGNHGMMPHGLQNLFIYQQLGKERTQNFFQHLSGWSYERLFDSNSIFTPIPATRDITRRHYWTGVFKAGNRGEVSRYGELIGEAGRYPEFLRKNNLELVAVEEIEINHVGVGSVIRARYRDTEFEFQVDKDGVPGPEAQTILDRVKAANGRGQPDPEEV